MLSQCLSGLKPMIMSDRRNGPLYADPRVFGAESYSYYLRHLRDNFVKVPAKLGVCSYSCKELVKEMFNRVAYAPTQLEYDVALEKVRAYKPSLMTWVEDNDLK